MDRVAAQHFQTKICVTCVTFSDEDLKCNKVGASRERCKTFALVGATVLALTFLGLFVWQLYSKPASQPGDWQAQLQNQTTQAQAQLKMCTEALKKDQDKAKKESDELRAQLLILQDNVASQSKEISKERAEKLKLQEEIQQFWRQISEWGKQQKQKQSKSRGTTIRGLGITFLLPLLILVLL